MVALCRNLTHELSGEKIDERMGMKHRMRDHSSTPGNMALTHGETILVSPPACLSIIGPK